MDDNFPLVRAVEHSESCDMHATQPLLCQLCMLVSEKEKDPTLPITEKEKTSWEWTPSIIKGRCLSGKALSLPGLICVFLSRYNATVVCAGAGAAAARGNHHTARPAAVCAGATMSKPKMPRSHQHQRRTHVLPHDLLNVLPTVLRGLLVCQDQ